MFRTKGVEWDRVNDISNSYYATKLFYQDKTELFFNNLINSPKRGIVCLEFKYKKHSRCNKILNTSKFLIYFLKMEEKVRLV